MAEPRPTDPPSMSDLARAHAPRAARIAIAIAAAVALLATTGAAIRFAQHEISHPPPRPVTPPDVEHPTLAWTGTTRYGPITGVAAFGDTLYAGTGDGLIAYPLPCPAVERECRPAWHDPITDGPLSPPASNGDEVYAGSAEGSVYAFPAACADPYCEPLWRGEAGSGPVSAPGVNDDFVYVASTSLYAFPARCGDAGLVCPPAWVGPIPGRVSEGSPAVGAGLVVVSWRDAKRGGVAAFPAVCVDRCDPVWTANTHGPATSVMLSADTAYVVAGGQLMAFPLSCRDACEPSWVGPFLMGLPYAVGAREAPTLDHDRVYVGGADGRLWVFPSSCDTRTCVSLASYPLGHEPLLAPIGRNGVVYVASVDGTLTAVDESCGDGGDRSRTCDDPWTDALRHPVGTGPDSTDDVLYVGDDAGTVHAFAIPRG
jgi:outer membrane protein assembly factor BamB